ncbi:MAG: YggT family protein [Firmicutes bacterium]|jgi:uncharacterized protein YggT (Ycf19 family)|nr:YggT family protein [Bacillota bacterium]
MVNRILVDLLEAYFIVIFVRILLTWFPMRPETLIYRVEKTLAKVTDPVLNPVRKLMPKFSAGAMALDLSPIVVLLVLGVIIGLLGGKGFLGGI